MKKIILINIILFLTGFSFGQTGKSDSILRKELSRIELKNDSLKARINDIITSQKLLEQKLANEQDRQEGLANSVDVLNQNSVHSSTLSKIGAIILLLGLFIEVIGATLLAGADLSSEIELIRSVRLEYTLGDLAIQDKMKDNVMSFYGILGSILLVIGFCFQFTGTIIILGLPWYIVVAFIMFAIISSFAVLNFLASQNVNQSAQEKREILFRNLKRILIFPVKQKLSGKKKVVCEICQKTMKYSDAEIWYKQESNSDQFQYLHPPYGFYLGHPDCLKEIYPDLGIAESSFMPPHPLYKKRAHEFYKTNLDSLYEWNEKRLKNLQEKRNSDKKIFDETEVSLRHLKVLLSAKEI